MYNKDKGGIHCITTEGGTKGNAMGLPITAGSMLQYCIYKLSSLQSRHFGQCVHSNGYGLLRET